jgi:hypothetical protein
LLWQEQHSKIRRLKFKEETGQRLLTRYDASFVWCFRKVDQKYLGSFKKWCWRRIQNIIWTDRARNEILHTVKEERNIIRTIKRKKDNCIGQTLRRNCHLKLVIERKIVEGIKVTKRRGRRCKQLLDDLKEIIKYRKMKKKTLARTLSRTCFAKCFGPVGRQTAE